MIVGDFRRFLERMHMTGHWHQFCVAVRKSSQPRLFPRHTVVLSLSLKDRRTQWIHFRDRFVIRVDLKRSSLEVGSPTFSDSIGCQCTALALAVQGPPQDVTFSVPTHEASSVSSRMKRRKSASTVKLFRWFLTIALVQITLMLGLSDLTRTWDHGASVPISGVANSLARTRNSALAVVDQPPLPMCDFMYEETALTIFDPNATALVPVSSGQVCPSHGQVSGDSALDLVQDLSGEQGAISAPSAKHSPRRSRGWQRHTSRATRVMLITLLAYHGVVGLF